MARMFRKSLAGWSKVKTTVESPTAFTPAMSWPLIYAAIDAASPLTFAKPSQYAFMPTIVSV
jgi:hypothetical protein